MILTLSSVIHDTSSSGLLSFIFIIHTWHNPQNKFRLCLFRKCYSTSILRKKQLTVVC